MMIVAEAGEATTIDTSEVGILHSLRRTTNENFLLNKEWYVR